MKSRNFMTAGLTVLLVLFAIGPLFSQYLVRVKYAPQSEVFVFNEAADVDTLTGVAADQDTIDIHLLYKGLYPELVTVLWDLTEINNQDTVLVDIVQGIDGEFETVVTADTLLTTGNSGVVVRSYSTFAAQDETVALNLRRHIQSAETLRFLIRQVTLAADTDSVAYGVRAFGVYRMRNKN